MKRMLAVAALISAAAAAALGVRAYAADLSGREIIEKVRTATRAKDEAVELTMDLLNKVGQKRSHTLTLQTKIGADDNGKVLVRFQAPPDLKGIGLLTVENGAGDEQWIYMPSARKTKRLAGVSRSESFMQSDFSHYDIRTEALNDHEYENAGVEKVDGHDCFKVVAKSKSDEVAERSGYARRVVFVDKARWVILKIDYFDRKGEALKSLGAGGWHEVSGFWRPETLVMENARDGTKTTVVFSKPSRKINQGIDDAVFSKRALENP